MCMCETTRGGINWAAAVIIIVVVVAVAVMIKAIGAATSVVAHTSTIMVRVYIVHSNVAYANVARGDLSNAANPVAEHTTV